MKQATETAIGFVVVILGYEVKKVVSWKLWVPIAAKLLVITEIVVSFPI